MYRCRLNALRENFDNTPAYNDYLEEKEETSAQFTCLQTLTFLLANSVVALEILILVSYRTSLLF